MATSVGIKKVHLNGIGGEDDQEIERCSIQVGRCFV